MVLCDYLEGWDGVGVGGRFKREGTCVYLLLIHAVVWQKPIQHCKAIIFQLKNIKRRERESSPVNEIESAEVMWMNLDSVIQREVIQKEKNKYHVLMQIYGI